MSACVTQQKCIEKFPNREIERDTIEVLIKDTVFKEIQTWTESSEVDFFDPFEFLPRDTVIIRTNDTVTLTIEKKAGQTSVKCKAESYLLTIDSLLIEVEYLQRTIAVTEQAYFDQKAENKRLKIETKEAVRKAKSEKIKQRAKSFMWLFLIVLILAATLTIHRYFNN